MKHCLYQKKKRLLFCTGPSHFERVETKVVHSFIFLFIYFVIRSKFSPSLRVELAGDYFEKSEPAMPCRGKEDMVISGAQ